MNTSNNERVIPCNKHLRLYGMESRHTAGVPPLGGEMESVRAGKCIIGESYTSVITKTKTGTVLSNCFW